MPGVSISAGTVLPAPIIIFFPICIPLTITDWLPIKQLSPILQSPLTMVPVEIWQWLPMTTSCSILQKVLMITLFPIFAPVLTNALCMTTEPGPMHACRETWAVLAISVAKVPPRFWILEYNPMRFSGFLMNPMVTRYSQLSSQVFPGWGGLRFPLLR